MIESYYLLLWVSVFFVVGQTQRCTVTSRDQEGPFYENGAPHRHPVRSLAPRSELTPETKITVQGFVRDKNCNPIKGAKVQAWYAGGNPTAYTFPPENLWYRGYVVTDQNGRYSFVATYPGIYTERPIPHIHMKAITPTKELTTQLYFRNDVPASYEDYVRGRDSQFPANIRATRSGRKINFDLVMDYTI